MNTNTDLCAIRTNWYRYQACVEAHWLSVRERGNVPVGGTLYVASFVVERNVWDAFEGKIEDIISEWPKLHHSPATCTVGSATSMPLIPFQICRLCFHGPAVRLQHLLR